MQTQISVEGDRVTVGTILNRFGGESFGVICLVLAIPFLIPISLGPLASIGGLTFAALGFQLFRGRETPWVPAKISSIQLKLEQAKKITDKAHKILHWAHLEDLTPGKSVNGRNLGVLYMIAGFLMALPFFGLPLNNTLPALSIICTAIAELRDSKRWIVGSIIWIIITCGYFAMVLYLLFTYGREALTWIV